MDMDNPRWVSPLNAVFSRYTRYAATTRANIDDFGDWSRYTEPLQALHPRWLVIGEWTRVRPDLGIEDDDDDDDDEIGKLSSPAGSGFKP